MENENREKLSMSPAWNNGNNAEKPEETPSQVVGQVKSFCAETTAHGFGQIVKAEVRIWHRITWIVIVLIVLGLACMHVTFVVQAYLAYPSQETTALLSKTPKFPYVTVCNSMAQSENRSMRQSQDSSTDYAQYIELISDRESDLLAYEQSTGIALDDIMLSPGGIFANIRKSEVRTVGHQLTDFILSCKYLDTDCDMENDWIRTLHLEFFNCYTYIGGARTGKTAAGPQYGLSLILYMENVVPGAESLNWTYNIYSNIQNAFGSRLEIHEPKTLPTPSETGIEIMPGHSTSIELSSTEIKKLIKPWGDCTKQKQLTELKNYKYTSTSCLATCLAKRIFYQCGCYSYHPPTDSMPSNYKMCTYFNNNTMTFADLTNNVDCARSQRLKFNYKQKLRTACNCSEPCSYRKYDMTISETVWPASLYHLDAYNEYVLTHTDVDNLLAFHQMGDAWNEANQGQHTDVFSSLMYNNFARVNVYFEAMSVLYREQTKSMSFFDMFANLGGTLGLWAGLSMCTFTEIVFFLIRLCVMAGHKCREKGKNRTSQVHL